MAKISLLPRDILTDLGSPKALAGISIGLVISLMAIVIQISLAAMIFSGPLESHAQRGMGLTLAGGAVLLAVTALFSGFRSNVNLPQDAPVAIFTGAAAGIAATLGMGHTEEAFITVVAALMLSTLATAAFFFLVAKKKLADYIRFTPYPVVAGFLAGTGWLLTKGSLEVMTGISLSWDALPSLLSRELLPFWAPGVVYAGLLFFGLRRWSHFLILPGSMVVALVLYHAALPLLGLDMAQARELRLFFSSFSSANIWPPFTPLDLQHVQWAALVREIPTLAVIPFIALLGLLLNTGGIELAARRDLDLNRELLVNSGGNALAALTGSHAGYSALSLSMLGFKTGADTRIVGLTAALVLAGTLLFGGQVLSIFPKALLGGFLLLIGLFFISDWIVDTRKRMPRPDYIVVLTVFATIGVFGYLQGVLLGLLATVALFTAKISRIPAIEAVSNISRTRSRKSRPIPHQHLLTVHGRGARLFKLNGFLFFGSVNSLTTSVMEALHDDSTRYILVDFQNVSGFDVSAVNNFVRLAQRMSSRNVAFLLAGPPDLFTDLLRQIGGEDQARSYNVFPSGNTALEWCEDDIIRSAHAALAEQSEQAQHDRDELFDTVADELLSELNRQETIESLLSAIEPYLESQTFPPGQTLLGQGDLGPGIIFVRQGAVLERFTDTSGGSSTLRTLGPGSFFSEPAAYGTWRSSHGYQAESTVQIALLTPKAFLELENITPEAARKIHRLVVAALIANLATDLRSTEWTP
ncbi:SLC26A/SulP transporter family protein [Desulfonatronum sp. SC1]|uniref:SLC26A/SulP transporter family protein n=1 Tax=Desulfonatronum sp. SC1 TaxID=2109626 RepID=UPI0013048CB4|nr:SulP family inorganic anion transporter [Desulfonatronum sp. SC1]